MRNDAELQKVLQDPELQKNLQNGNVLAVLTHPGGNKLLKALLSPSASTADKQTEDSSSSSTTESKTLPVNNQVYQWVDEEGRTHFSDEKPR